MLCQCSCCSALPIQLPWCVNVVFLLQYPTHPVAIMCQRGLPVEVLYPSNSHGVLMLFTCCSTLPIQWPCCVSIVYLLQYPTCSVAMVCQCYLPVAVPYPFSCHNVSAWFTCWSTLPIQLPWCFDVVYLLQCPTHSLSIQLPCCVSVVIAKEGQSQIVSELLYRQPKQPSQQDFTLSYPQPAQDRSWETACRRTSRF